MPIRITCPDCKTSMRLSDDLRGKRVRCKNCKTTFRIPASKDDEDPDEGPPPRRTQKEASSFPLIPIILGVVGLSLILCFAGSGFGIYFAFFRSPRAPEQAKGDAKPKEDPKAEQKVEPVTIKLKRRGAGESAAVAETVSRKFKLKSTDEKGKVLIDLDGNDVLVLEYVETILKHDKFPTRLEREYSKAQFTRDGKTTDWPIVGRTVLIQKSTTGNPPKFSYLLKGGGQLPPEFTRHLSDEFGGKKGGPLDDPEIFILPRSAVKPGDSWRPDTELLLKDLAKDSKDKVEFGTASAEASLVKTYPKDGRQHGVIEAKIEILLKADKVGTKDEIRYRDGSKLLFEFNLDLCIDGSAEVGNSRIKMTMDQDGAFVKRKGASELTSFVQEVTRTASMPPKTEKPGTEKPKSKDELIAIQLKKRGEGESAFVTRNRAATSKMLFTDANGKTLVDENTKDTEFMHFEEKILQCDGTGRAIKLERNYSSAKSNLKGKVTEWPVVGTWIVIEQRGGKFTFAYKSKGDPLPAGFAAGLAKEFVGAGDAQDDFQKMALPATPVKAGDSWQPDVEFLVKQFGQSGAFDIDRGSTATGRLVRTYQQANQQRGVIEAKFELPLKSLGNGPGQIRFTQGGKLQLDIAMDVCIDGTVEAGVVSVRITITGKGTAASTPGSSIVLDNSDEVSLTITPKAP